ncbi:MAG: hybrid sensor histidine kinase/response regulator [Ignavibacteriales bacterium]|nr:hybrid sensor histidine kinase/response regulator [Ignavibacteriales bacterium]
MNRILLVDDEQAYRQTISNALRQGGYCVFEAGDGEKGIEIAQNEKVDLIISDVMMDKLDGFAMIDRLRMDPATCTIPFILMTGLADQESRRRGMTLGADDFLVKPFTGSELMTAIETRLARHREMIMETERKLVQLRSSITLALPHELRTPLASILGFAEIIGDENGGLPAADIAQFGKMIHQAGKRLERLLENFTIYAQIEVAASDPKKVASLRETQLTNTAELLRNLCTTTAAIYRRETDLTLDLSDAPVAMSAQFLQKVCEELLDNAFKFSEAGKEVTVTAAKTNGKCVATIEDRGRGMTANQLASMGAYVQFERRVHEQQGTGLGLIIAKKLVEIHGGTIEFVATAGGGLTTIVSLPSSPTS